MKPNIQEYFSRKQIGEIALAYSTGTYSYHAFLHQYPNCNQHNFYTLLHIAVEKAIVPESVARKIQEIAVANSVQKAQETYTDPNYVAYIQIRIFNSWERRIIKSKIFKFSKKEGKIFVQNYSKSTLSKSEFCTANCISKALFESTLIDAVIYSWIDDECFDALYHKEIQHSHHPENVEHFFWQLTKARNRNKTSKK